LTHHSITCRNGKEKREKAEDVNSMKAYVAVVTPKAEFSGADKLLYK
jgi:hypothetical protein